MRRFSARSKVAVAVRNAMASLPAWCLALAVVICLGPAALAGNRQTRERVGASAILSGHTDGVHLVAFLPDGKRLVSASHDGTVKMWDVETGECLHTFAGHEKPVRAV